MSNKDDRVPLSDDVRSSLFGQLHERPSEPDVPRERLDMSRMVMYPQGMDEYQARDKFRAKYGVEPTITVKGHGKGFGYAVGYLPLNWKEQ